MPKVCKEEKAIYGIMFADEGNWARGQFTFKGDSWGAVDMPLSFLPTLLQNRLKNGARVNIRMLISEDGERRVTPREQVGYQYHA